MDVIDDSTLPDDLAELLRRASSRTPVAPASLSSVERRVRQRRRRRRAVATSGVAVVLIVVAVLVTRAVVDDGSQRVVTATDPETPLVGTVPQPLLLWGGALGPRDPGSGAVNRDGSWLDEITPTGSSHWWRSEPGYQAVSGVVLPDGRRFGLGVQEALHDTATYRTVLDEVGPDGRTVDSTVLSEPGGGGMTPIELIGASGPEVILERTTATPSTTEHGAPTLTTASTFTALDVDTGAERTIAEGLAAGTGASAAAADRLVVAGGTSCTIMVQALHGSGAPRTIEGGCPAGPDGLDGMAVDAAVSPDGRYAAVVWNMIRSEGSPRYAIDVIDLDTGRIEHTTEASSLWPVVRIAFTGRRTLTAAVDPDKGSLEPEAGPITIETAPFAQTG